MNNNSQTYKSIFLVVILLFGVLTLYSLNTNETPRFILALGRFHPLLLHLPIGALVVTFFIDILGRIQDKYPKSIIRNLLGFTSIFAILTCFLGHFLSLEGGYQKETLVVHFYSGIITAILALILFILSFKPSFQTNKLFLPIFIISLISISITGHYGSVLTHGDNFLSEYLKESKKDKTIEVIDSLKMHDDVIAKILEDKCVQCHNASKQKGELSLISKDMILKGGVSGKSIVSRNAKKSLLYSRLLLPISDEEHMPPEGKPQLTKQELWLIEHWINNGADFENYATKISNNDTLQRSLQNYLILDKVKIQRADPEAIDNVKKYNFRIIELVPGEGALNLKFLDSIVSDDAISQLLTLNEQIVELDFNDARITDRQIARFEEFKHLKMLRMNYDSISDQSLNHLKSLEQLEVLNVYNTNITNEGLSSLLETVKPKRIYTWNTRVDEDHAKELAAKNHIIIQNSIVSGFVEDSRLEPPLISPLKTLFADTIHVNSISKIKNVVLRYTVDGSDPDENSKIFEGPLVLNSSTSFKIAAYKKGWNPSDVISIEYSKVDSHITNFKLEELPDKRYSNKSKLFDLIEGSLNFKDGHWVGYFGNDLNVTIDLGKKKMVNQLTISCLEDLNSWILYPKQLIVYVSHTKNGNYSEIGRLKMHKQNKVFDARKSKFSVSFPQREGQFFKVKVKNHDVLPKWHPNAGKPSWLFVDEIYFNLK